MAADADINKVKQERNDNILFSLDCRNPLQLSPPKKYMLLSCERSNTLKTSSKTGLINIQSVSWTKCTDEELDLVPGHRTIRQSGFEISI